MNEIFPHYFNFFDIMVSRYITYVCKENDVEIKDVRWFIKERKAQFDCAKEITGFDKNVACIAPVKCGKREIVICCSLLKNNCVHIYMVNLERVDMYEQLVELREYGIYTFVGKSIRKNYEESKLQIQEFLRQGLTVYLHVDELDYGSGDEQCLAELLEFTKTTTVKHVFYSATPQELLYSDMDIEKVYFVPDKSYIGVEYFLQNDLVKQSTEPFFVYDKNGKLVLSAQGVECCKLIDIKQGMHIGVVRITTQMNKSSLYQSVKSEFGATNSSIKKSLDKIFGKNNYVVKFTDQSSSLYWGAREKNTKSLTAWYDLPFNKPVLHIINQTCTRSAEWALQNHLAFYHSYRKNSFITTNLQGDSRMFGYRDTNCTIYTSSVEAFAVPAYDEQYLQEILFENDLKLSQRTQSKGGIGKSGRAKPGSYDVHFLFEGITPESDLQIYEFDDPIHKKGSKKDNNPSIRYKGHLYRWCNKVSNWGSSDTTSRSDLAGFLARGSMALSQSSSLTFAMIDKPSGERKDWSDSFKRLCAIDERIPLTLDKGKRVFAVFVLKKQSDILTKDNSIYAKLGSQNIDLFTE
jgi:hypothetical protein